MWSLIAATEAGFAWLAIAGKTLKGWIVTGRDATLITACSEKEGAAPTFKKGFGFHRLGTWCANTRKCLAMLMRPLTTARRRVLFTRGPMITTADEQAITLLPAGARTAAADRAGARGDHRRATWQQKEAFVLCWRRLCALPTPS